MHYDFLDCDIQDGVARISLLGADGLGLAEFSEEFTDLLLRLQEDRAARVLLLTDDGGSLDMAMDRRALAERWARGEGPTQAAADLDIVRRLVTLMLEQAKPLIAAVRGDVRDGGFGLVMNCDVRLCTSGAVFTPPAMAQGMLPDWGLSHLLPRRLGPGRTLDLLWSGRGVGGEEAVRLGLADRLIDTDVWEQDVEEFARHVAELPQPAVHLSKLTVQQSSDFDFTTALSLEFESQSQCWDSRETSEAMAAHRDGRPPLYFVDAEDEED